MRMRSSSKPIVLPAGSLSPRSSTPTRASRFSRNDPVKAGMGVVALPVIGSPRIGRIDAMVPKRRGSRRGMGVRGRGAMAFRPAAPRTGKYVSAAVLARSLCRLPTTMCQLSHLGISAPRMQTEQGSGGCFTIKISMRCSFTGSGEIHVRVLAYSAQAAC